MAEAEKIYLSQFRSEPWHVSKTAPYWQTWFMVASKSWLLAAGGPDGVMPGW